MLSSPCTLQEGIQLTLDKYPETLQVDLGVAAMGVESPEGTFIRTGAELHRLPSATDLTGGCCTVLLLKKRRTAGDLAQCAAWVGSSLAPQSRQAFTSCLPPVCTQYLRRS